MSISKIFENEQLKYRLIGVIGIIITLLIFIPIVFDRPDEIRETIIDVPARPQANTIKSRPAEQIAVPNMEFEEINEDFAPSNAISQNTETKSDVPNNNANADKQTTVITNTTNITAEKNEKSSNKPKTVISNTTKEKEAAKPKLDANGLPITWSVQLASFSNRESALKLQKTLRDGGYNAYIRENNKMHRVFVGPVIERREAQKILDNIEKKHKLKGFIVRFNPNS